MTNLTISHISNSSHFSTPSASRSDTSTPSTDDIDLNAPLSAVFAIVESFINSLNDKTLMVINQGKEQLSNAQANLTQAFQRDENSATDLYDGKDNPYHNYMHLLNDPNTSSDNIGIFQTDYSNDNTAYNKNIDTLNSQFGVIDGISSPTAQNVATFTQLLQSISQYAQQASNLSLN